MWEVRCWPFGEGEPVSELEPQMPEAETFATIEQALLRAIEEVAEWTHALLDPANGDAPSDEGEHGSIMDYARNGAMTAATSIMEAARSWNYDADQVDDSRWEIDGPCGNDVVVIERVG